MLKTVLLVVVIFFTSFTFAEPLDVLVNKLNQELNPKKINQTGIQIDWREDRDYVWFNIHPVTFLCQKENRTFLVEKKLITKHIEYCRNRITKVEDSLFQIMCEDSRGKDCKKLFLDLITADVIKLQVNSRIESVYLKKENIK